MPPHRDTDRAYHAHGAIEPDTIASTKGRNAMGHFISASCTCGYSNEHLSIGGGMLTFTTVCDHPAYCAAGRHVVTVNLMEQPITCPEGCAGTPLPYCKTPSLQIKRGKGLVSDWDGLKINTGLYKCPRCEAYSLQFHEKHAYFD